MKGKNAVWFMLVTATACSDPCKTNGDLARGGCYDVLARVARPTSAAQVTFATELCESTGAEAVKDCKNGTVPAAPSLWKAKSHDHDVEREVFATCQTFRQGLRQEMMRICGGEGSPGTVDAREGGSIGDDDRVEYCRIATNKTSAMVFCNSGDDRSKLPSALNVPVDPAAEDDELFAKLATLHPVAWDESISNQLTCTNRPASSDATDEFARVERESRRKACEEELAKKTLPQLAILELPLEGGAEYNFNEGAYCLPVTAPFRVAMDAEWLLVEFASDKRLALSNMPLFGYASGRINHPCARLFAPISKAKALKSRLGTAARGLRVRLLFRPGLYGATGWKEMLVRDLNGVSGAAIGYTILADDGSTLMPWTSMKKALW